MRKWNPVPFASSGNNFKGGSISNEWWTQFFDKVLTLHDFMPHGHCWFWQKDLTVLSVIGDAAIALAYFIVPILLVVITWGQLKTFYSSTFHWLGWFVLLCGLTHVFDLVTVFVPCYYLQDIFKLLTGIIVWVALFWLIRQVPKLRTLLILLEYYKEEIKQIFRED